MKMANLKKNVIIIEITKENNALALSKQMLKLNRIKINKKKIITGYNMKIN